MKELNHLEREYIQYIKESYEKYPKEFVDECLKKFCFSMKHGAFYCCFENPAYDCSIFEVCRFKNKNIAKSELME